MNLEEFKDINEINKLASEWLEEYKSKNLGAKSKKLKRQAKEMAILKAKTDNIKDRQGGDHDASDWKSLYSEITKEAKDSPFFAICFGNASDALSTQSSINEKETVAALKLKKMTAAWFGQFGEEVKDAKVITFITMVYEQAQKLLIAPKKAAGDIVTLTFYGSNSKRCRKMNNRLNFIINEYAGIVNVEIVGLKEEDKSMATIGVDNLPAIVFKRGQKKIATHEGELSVAAVESKLNVLLEGGNITDSSSVPSINDMKSVNKKELYSLGEFLVFYFDATWCGACKKTTPVVEKYARNYNNVKFEIVTVDGSHSHHKTFGVTHVPSIVFVRGGVVIGRHVGYINPSTFAKKMDLFAISKKRKIGLSKDENCSPIPTEKEQDSKSDPHLTSKKIFPPKTQKLVDEIKAKMNKGQAEIFEKKITSMYKVHIIESKQKTKGYKQNMKKAFHNALEKKRENTSINDLSSEYSQIDTYGSTIPGAKEEPNKKRNAITNIDTVLTPPHTNGNNR